MDTLIELYGERAIENVIGPEIFNPTRVIYLCPPEIAQDKRKHEILRDFFIHRGHNFDLQFVESSFYKSKKILSQLLKIKDTYSDCALDVTGGTDAALIAAGMFCNQANVPVFTYSRKRKRFYDIDQAEFVEEFDCSVSYSVEDFFLMTGGKLRKGRVDNVRLAEHENSFIEFFNLFLSHRRAWPSIVNTFQHLSKVNNSATSLKVKNAHYTKNNPSARHIVSPEILDYLEKLGFIRNIEYKDSETVSFRFADNECRAWLCDVGSALELYMYKICKDMGVFDDVISSAVVDWDSSMGNKSISNEIDAVATRGVVPLFISCKACDIKTVALNELSIIKDRFGGKGAKAVIVTTEHCNSLARHRAAQLGIAVVDLEEFKTNEVPERLKIIMKVE